MKIRFAVPLFLLIFAPLGLLAWLGVLLASQERETVENRLLGLVREEVEGIVTRIDNLIEEREREMLAEMDTYVSGGVSIERMGSALPFVSKSFLLDVNRKPIHPLSGQGGDDFLNRTEDLWGDTSLFIPTTEQEITQTLRAGRILDANDTFGWQTWFWNRGLNFLFWRALPDGETLGFEINRSRIVADLIDELPDTTASSRSEEGKSFHLCDEQGDLLYQWGTLSPDPEAKPLLTQNLRAPLGSWSIQVFAPPEFLNTDRNSFFAWSLWMGLLAVGLGLLAIGFFVVREYTREMREAEQRVSFVNQVSHELKTPLTNIRMYAELLREEISEDLPSLSKKAGIIVEESGRLSRLIGNILTFSRKERAKLKLHFSRGCLDETVRSTLDHYRPSLAAKEIEVGLDLKTPEEVLFDSDAIGQIVGNLLSNVEKYCPTATPVMLRTGRNGAVMTLEIEDRGPGIPRNESKKIFRPFYRISNELTDGVTGTGIGLSISRDLARMHGGDLVLLPGERGALFRLTFQIQSIKENKDS